MYVATLLDLWHQEQKEHDDEDEPDYEDDDDETHRPSVLRDEALRRYAEVRTFQTIAQHVREQKKAEKQAMEDKVKANMAVKANLRAEASFRALERATSTKKRGIDHHVDTGLRRCGST